MTETTAPHVEEGAKDRPPTLSEFIARYEREILDEWERTVRELPAAKALDRPALIDHIPELLRRIRDLTEHASAGPAPTTPTTLAEVADELTERHAIERLEEGFDLAHVVREFGALRDAVARLWEETHRDPVEIYDARVLNHAIDKAVSESVQRYTHARDRALLGLDRIANEALESRDLDDLLRRLLAVLLETTPALDTAAILLRERDSDDTLVVRAVAGGRGGSGDKLVGTRWAVGAGLAGRVAQDGRPAHANAPAGEAALDVSGEALPDPRLKSLYAVPLVDGGRPLGVVQFGSFTAHDLSRQDKRLVNALAARATAALYQHMLREQSERALAVIDALLKASSAGIAFLDADLRYVLVNEALAALNGRPPQEHVGRRASEIIGKEQAQAVDQLLQRVLETHKPIENLELEAPRIAGDGGPHTFLASFFPVVTDAGELLGVGVVVVEITERKRAERELRLSEARLSAILENAPIAIYMKDLAGRYLMTNRVGARYGDRRVGDVVDKTTAEVLPEHRRARLEEQDARVAAGAVIETEERVVVDGEERVLLSVKFPVPGPDGERLVCGVAKDITERKHAEEELGRAVSLREQILAIVSHDLKNPLATIDLAVTMVEQAVDAAVPTKARRHLATIKRASGRMKSLIGDLLDMAALRAGRLSIDQEPTNIEELLRDIVEQNAAAAAAKGLVLALDASSIGAGAGGEAVFVRCDRDKIAQVLANLVGNAIKFTEAGGVHVAARKDSDADVVTVAVTDTGPGIAKSALPHIFEAYWSGAERTKKKGTGLGLFIAKGIVEAHGGTIAVKATSPKGTEIAFTLPVAHRPQ